MRLLSVFGTRPEAVKIAAVLRALAAEPAAESVICVTGQHRELLDPVLDLFGIVPNFDLALMEPGQPLNALAARAIGRIDAVLEAVKPDRLLVQGDTTSALAAALAAFHRGIPVAHVEAGLRTYVPAAPWPEETNRRAVALVADLHFAPTEAAKANLLAERLHGEVYVTGNSGIDALRHISERLETDAALRGRADAALPPLDPDRKLVLVTAHRRESFGAPFRDICAAVEALAERADAEIVWPFHPNPQLGAPAGSGPRLRLLPPLDPAAFVRLMQRADMVLTDSGGVQEEAVALEKPVLVLRDATERSEAVAAGAARLVGTRTAGIVREAAALLDEPAAGGRFVRAPDLFGDGRAAARIVDALLGRPVAEFAAGPCPPAVTAAAE